MLKENFSSSTNEFIEMRQKIYSSSIGQKLNDSVRWERYNLDNLPNPEWQQILGFDANNLRHMHFIDRITIAFTSAQNKTQPGYFNQGEINSLRTTANVHDLPEAFTGDKTFELKTDDDEDIELQNMTRILNEIGIVQDLQQITQINNIIKDKTSKLGKSFNAIERLGYLRTGIVAFRKNPNHQKLNFDWISQNILLNQIPKLIEYSQEFTMVQEVFNKHQQEISQMFQQISLESFEFYSSEEKPIKLNQFQSASDQWFQWVNQQSYNH